MMTINQDFTDILRVEGVHAQGYGIVAKLAMRDRRLTPEAKAIYGYICSFAGAGSTAFPGSELMQGELCMSENRFLKHRKLLIQYGYISVTQGKGNGKAKKNTFKNNIYTIMTNPTPVINDEFPSLQIEGAEDLPSLRFAGTENEGMENEGAIINSLINNSLNNKEKKESKGQAELFELPRKTKDSVKKDSETFDNIINSAFPGDDMEEIKSTMVEFIKMRKLIKKPLTNYALKLIIKDLFKLASSVSEQIKILKQSISSSWAGVFPLKQEHAGNNANSDIQNPFLRKVLKRQQEETAAGRVDVTPQVDPLIAYLNKTGGMGL